MAEHMKVYCSLIPVLLCVSRLSRVVAFKEVTEGFRFHLGLHDSHSRERAGSCPRTFYYLSLSTAFTIHWLELVMCFYPCNGYGEIYLLSVSSMKKSITISEH